MKKKKIILIILCSIIGLIFLDFIVALSFNNSPIIKIKDYYNGGFVVYKDKGIFSNTYKCSDGKTKTVLKTTKFVCPIKDSKEEEQKEIITITFDTKGGSKIDRITINKETELILPKEPTRDGYVFKGWVDKNETPIYNKVLLAEDTTLYAVWEKDETSNTITITFDTKDGSKINSISINKETELTLPKEPTRDGYVFKGWVDKNETPIYNKVLLAEDTTLYAVWEKDETSNTITITFDTKDGSKINSISINKETELTLPKEPTRDGYVFKGWVDKNETPIYNKVLLAEDTTLYAVWEKVENKKTSPKTEEPKTNTNKNNNNNSTNTNKPNQNANNNTNINNNENPILPEEKPPVVEKTQAEKNDEYRKQLQNKYSVKIAYKNELGNYNINGYGLEKLNDDDKINNCLGEINTTLKNYPNGFFKEMKDYGMPLTIYLVNSISDDVSGLTDAKDKSDIKIMIAPASLFENTLNHEIMHYIDTYIKVKGYPIDINTTMKDVNPVGFTYGDTSNEYVYYFTSVDNAYFLSAYGKTNYLEDRAVLFSDMMTRTIKKPFYNDGTPINKKAKLISAQIKEHFNTLSNTGRYYWDRFL